jgi:hypothetical protein
MHTYNAQAHTQRHLHAYKRGTHGLAPAAGQDSGLVQQVSQVSSGKTRGTQGNLTELHALSQLLVACVHIEDGKAALLVRHIHSHLCVCVCARLCMSVSEGM